MAPINLAKLDEAKRAGKRMVGGLYRRIRPGVDGVKVQRAEIRFDDVARCLKIPTGGSSCQTIVIVESASVQSSTSSNCASSTRTGCRSAPSNVPQRRAAANLYPQSLLGRQIYWTALGEFDAAEEERSIKRTASTLRPFGRGNSTERGFRPFRGATQSRSAEAALAFLNSFAARASLRSTGPSISRGSGIGGIASFWHLRATATDIRRTLSSAERSRPS